MKIQTSAEWSVVGMVKMKIDDAEDMNIMSTYYLTVEEAQKLRDSLGVALQEADQVKLKREREAERYMNE